VKLRIPIVVVMLFLLILILPFFVSQVESGTSTNTYYPSNYNLSGSTQLVSGSVGNLQSDDGNYMTFRSYPNYDFRFGESLEESSWNTNTEYQDKVVLTFTPSVSADYIVIATAEVQGNCISPPDVKARLYIGVSICQELIYRVKDTTDWYPFCALKRVNLPASSQTLKIQYAISDTTATAKIRNARLYAFSLSGHYAESEAESSWNTNTNWQDKVALTFTPSTSGDYLIIATANVGGSSTDYSTLIQFLQDGSIVHAGPTRETSATEARYTFGVMRKINLDATSHTFKTQYKTENTLNTACINYAHIVAIRVDQFSNNYYAESEGESGPASSNTWYNKVTNTYTAQAADHLIIGSILYKAGSTSRSIGVKLLQGADVDQSLLVEHKDSTDYEGCFMMAKASLSAGSVTDKIQYMGESTSARVKNARLISLQLPIQHTVEVEFIGSSNTDDWTQLVWVVDSAWTTPSVTVTLQLYNYNLGQYPTSGDGYISYTSSATANTDETKSQTITTNPTSFRDGSGNWKIKVKGIKSTATQFDFEGDLIKFEVTYTLPPVNNPPIAYDQSVTTAEDTSKGITLTASDPDSDPLTYSIETGPSHGSLSGSPPSVTYTPDSNYNGADSFTFKAYDGQAYSNIANVSITVTPVNDPPVVSDIPNVTFPEDGSDSSIDLDNYVSDVDNTDAEMTWTFTGNVNIIVSINSVTRVVTFTAPANWFGQETITFRATDPSGLWDENTTIVTVTPVNDPPVASNLAISPTSPVTEDDLVGSYDYYDLEGDLESGTEIRWYKDSVLRSAYNDMLTIPSSATAKGESWYFTVKPKDGMDFGDLETSPTVVIGNSPPEASNLSINPSSPYTTDDLIGSYTYYDVDGDLESGSEIRWYKDDVLQPAFNDLLTVPSSATAKGQVWYFTVKPKDGTSFGALQTSPPVTIQNSSPTAPVVDVTPDFPLTTDDLTCTVVVPSIDPDGDTVTYTYEWYKNDVLQPAYTTSTLPASATTVGDVWKCVVTPHGSDGPPDWDEVTIQNSPPVLAYIGPKSINEGNMLSFTATATDSDVPPQTLTFSLGPGAPAGASITSGGVFTWTPTEAQGPGSYVIRIIVSDGSLQDYEDITVTVNEVNVAPILDPIGNKAVNELTLLTFTATASDADLPAQTLTFSLGAGSPAGASITSAGVFTWTPTEVQGPGSYVIRIIVSDGLAQDYEDITVTVNEVNQPPVLNPIGPKTVSVGDLLQFTVTASDPDLPAQTLTFSASNFPLGATFNPITRVFSWTPTSGQAGVYSGVHFEVSDGALTDSEDITITVIAPPPPPPPPPPVGGYSISLIKQTPVSQMTAYTMLIALFGVVLSLIKRKRK